MTMVRICNMCNLAFIPLDEPYQVGPPEYREIRYDRVVCVIGRRLIKR